MGGNAERKPSLDRPVSYQIKVPGHLDEPWSDWAGGLTITIKDRAGERPVTTLTGRLDQAALQGLLRRLYSLGVPLISVQWVPSNLANGSRNKQE
jgi:hypothetical protein